MLRWLFHGEHQAARSFDAPSESQSARDDRKTIGFGENYLLFDMIIGEIETAVVRFETQKELKAEEERKKERRPDYSWLVSGSARGARKQLSVHEKNRIENACERLKPCEWSKTIDTWKMKSQDPTCREDIIEQFVVATHETIQARKHEPSISEVIRNFATGRAASLHSIRHGELPTNQGSNRNLAELSFIELQEMV